MAATFTGIKFTQSGVREIIVRQDSVTGIHPGGDPAATVLQCGGFEIVIDGTPDDAVAALGWEIAAPNTNDQSEPQSPPTESENGQDE